MVESPAARARLVRQPSDGSEARPTRSSPTVKLVAVVIAASAVLLSDATPTPVLNVAGISIYVNDIVVSALLSIAAFIALLGNGVSHHGRTTAWLRPLGVTLSIITGFTVARGIATHGSYALVEARQLVHTILIVVALLAIHARLETPPWVAAATLARATAASLTALTAVRVAQRGLASSSDFFIDADGAYRTLRPIVADQAFALVAAALILTAVFLRFGSRFDGLLAIIAIAGLIVAQHRSTWAALAFGLTVLALKSRGAARTRILVSTFFATCGALAVASTSAASGLVSSIAASISAIGEPNSTLNDRTWGWNALITEQTQSGPLAVLFGLPWGGGYDRIGPNGELQLYSPHNFYVVLLLRVGLIGLVLCFAILLRTIRRIARSGTATGLLSAFVALLVYLTTYGMSVFSATILALAIAQACDGSTSFATVEQRVRSRDGRSIRSRYRTRSLNRRT